MSDLDAPTIHESWEHSSS